MKQHKPYHGYRKEELVARIEILERVNELQSKALTRAGIAIPSEEMLEAMKLGTPAFD